MIKCLSFRPYERNTLRGFADLEVTRAGLVFHDCLVHEMNGKQWVAFPARPYEDDDGVKRWQAVIKFARGAETEAFQRLAIEAINTYRKQNLEAASPPASDSPV